MMETTNISFSMLVIQLLNLLLALSLGYLLFLLIKALLRYLRAADVRKEKMETRRSLGECIREERTRCRMTQEFVAESLGVSRQAVSKWESGVSDPSTANLIALAKLFEVDAAEMLKDVKK